ncbi:MAG: right-handed parallel beta-helix repeat-containing protein [Alphaproteobacteria bacterium]|jgi:parallel beta-helix repeat protein|nr:right-handed parallel beta-helix repeat-containing protein [Alphaproteobacteria bacterium]MDP6564964.1 right-handed parallel beta-helix repeat-containing protein [Alphaproteobacteria bacterium]MDP6811812.1 right-handed parallel beta-helix repeat-containing protein [Alphaproteobacteria bacterium]
MTPVERTSWPLLLVLGISLLPLAGSAEVVIRFKDGRTVTLPYRAEQIDSIQFRDGTGDDAAAKPSLPKGGEVRIPRREGGPPTAIASWRDVRRAVKGAVAGDVITVPPGGYVLGRRDVIDFAASGTKERPIVLRAEKLGSVQLEVETVEAMRIAGSHLVIENFEMTGVCGAHDRCEHAIHLKPGARNVAIRSNRLIDFNAAIKSSVDRNGDGADDVLVEGNSIYNLTPRKTRNPVTPIDVNGGQRWRVIGNYIADFAKALRGKVSFGAFLKNNSRDGLFEANLIICEQRHTGGIRLGLSLGGGGSKSVVEHSNGTIRNNIIMNCPQDVGIYLNRAKDSRIYNNIIYNTVGIDVRYRQSTADIRNNVMSGRIKNRSGGSHQAVANRTQVSQRQFRAWFVDPRKGDFRPRDGAPVIAAGVAVPGGLKDFCGHARDSTSIDQGAMMAGGPPCERAKLLAGTRD